MNRVTMGRWRHAVAALASVAGTGTVLAQEAPKSPPQQHGPDVVVEAPRAPDARDVRDQVRAATRRIDGEKPLPLFRDPLCLASFGLRRALAEEILDRMVEIAEETKIRMAGANCTPNVVLLFVDDGAKEYAEMTKKGGSLARAIPYGEHRALLKETGPIRVWNMTEVRSRDGDPLMYNGGDGPPTLRVPTASRISSPIRVDMRASVLMIDRPALNGKTSVQVADYAAMRAFARTRPVEQPRLDTILRLFDREGAPAPAEMTAFDRGYLHGLYASNPGSRSYTQQGMIGRAIAKETAAPR